MISTAVLFAVLGAGEVVFLPSPRWTDELKEDVALGYAALPPAARLPLEVELREEATALGLGDATHPLLLAGRLQLYGFREDDDARAATRLSRLTGEERQRLWRRRAVVHAVIRKWDERLRWSARAGWKALAGWDGASPLLVYPWAYSRRGGMQSPALDLATFAEELLVPAESLHEAAVPKDDRLRCREPSKARFLDERLSALDPSWKPGAADCPAYEAWADLEHLPKFEVVFATPSSSSAQALFGHLLLRLVREDDDGDLGAMQVMQLAALVSPLEPSSSYLLRGLSGGFRGVFSLTTLADVQQEALSLEQRSLRRFALELTVDQRQRLLERVWELERVGYIDYRFFKANCATMLRFLVTPALGAQAPGPTLTPWETPTQVLDGLAGLISGVETDEPSGLVAWRARNLSPSPPRGRGSGRGLTGNAPDDEALRARALLAALRIERHALDEATVGRIQAARAAVLPGWTGPSTDELVAARQRRYERELSPQHRAQAELADLLALDELLRNAPRRPPHAGELAALAKEKEAREAFEAVADAVAALPEEVLERAREEERAAFREFQAETTRRAVPEGGHGHAELAAGVSETLTPLLRLRAAAVVEQLGDQRQRGFGSRSAWRVLDASVLLQPKAQPVYRAGLLLLGTRNVGLNGWGWGLGTDYDFDARAHELAASGELLRVIASDQRFSHFLLLTLGARGGARVDELASAVLYPRAGLALRLQLPGSFGNALRFEGAYLPRLRVGSGFEHGVSGALQLALRLGAAGGLGFTARADLVAEWRPLTGLTGFATLGVELD